MSAYKDFCKTMENKLDFYLLADLKVSSLVWFSKMSVKQNVWNCSISVNLIFSSCAMRMMKSN